MWRETHDTFVDFCREELDLSQARVSQLIQCAEQIAQLEQEVDKELIPTSERAIRELRRAKKVNRVKVLMEAVKLASDNRPSTAQIEQAREAIEGPRNSSQHVVKVKADTVIKAAQTLNAFLQECKMDDIAHGDVKTIRKLTEEISQKASNLSAAA